MSNYTKYQRIPKHLKVSSRNGHPPPKQRIDEDEHSVRKGPSRASRQPGGRRPTRPVRHFGRSVTASTGDPKTGPRTLGESSMTSGQKPSRPEKHPRQSEQRQRSRMDDSTSAATESYRLSRSTSKIGTDGGSTDWPYKETSQGFLSKSQTATGHRPVPSPLAATKISQTRRRSKNGYSHI